ncbi:MAG: phosphoribosylformylglycinamidine synthase [Myxococcales bacterium FL481]|nr:MAG: phosphoribosylformylglycinamidine synthase [Myxococcales bacterium FL481]
MSSPKVVESGRLVTTWRMTAVSDSCHAWSRSCDCRLPRVADGSSASCWAIYGLVRVAIRRRTRQSAKASRSYRRICGLREPAPAIRRPITAHTTGCTSNRYRPVHKRVQGVCVGVKQTAQRRWVRGLGRRHLCGAAWPRMTGPRGLAPWRHELGAASDRVHSRRPAARRLTFSAKRTKRGPVTVHRLEIEAKHGRDDAFAHELDQRLRSWLGLTASALRTRDVVWLDLGLRDDEAHRVLAALVDPVVEQGALGMLADGFDDSDVSAARGDLTDAAAAIVTVGFLPGVTDAVATSVKRAAEDVVERRLSGAVYTAKLVRVWGLSSDEVRRAKDEVLHNPLIHRARIESVPRALDLDVPRAGNHDARPRTRSVRLDGLDDEALMALSKAGMLALSVAEMRVIQGHFADLGRDPTDAELECLAQTWSEHCKHKIFASPISYAEGGGDAELIETGLFRTHIRGCTEAIAAARESEGVDGDAPFLVSVFHDNAGVVRFTEQDHLVFKVETHNSPSALDPYGGAMTGIVGVNRDSFGTGVGADLLTNVWGYCTGDPHYEGPLPKGLMLPRRIRDGVHAGVIDGGNHSGIPYSRGFELFDERYAGKPLVYCGTVAVMPIESAGHPTHQKRAAVGDRVVMVGGRIGKDGIHGATFSSVELDEGSPVQAVQIGDPITQKLMFDFLTEARDQGLFSSMTDNGAGGLSSSVGEMAQATGGARIDLATAPVKYPGLAPWEILVSEAQERMTLAVPPSDLDAFLSLAERREVEATVIGEFTDSGRFEVNYGEERVCDLALSFLHDGVPLPTLSARFDPPRSQSDAPWLDGVGDLSARLLQLLGRPGLCSGEEKARHYDHEVKGLSVIKPYIGVRGDVPSTAAVMRGRHRDQAGVVLGEGILPYYSDIDTHAMALAVVDEGVRRVLCAGARLDRLSALDNFCWPDPIVGPNNPDGEHKLAQLVRCCRGLDEACRAYGMPLISGKDSMKNDADLDGVKISIPPTLLVSVMGQMPDVRAALSLEPRYEGDVVYLLGPTRSEFGGSELARACGAASTSVPRTDVTAAAHRYRAFVALRDRGQVRSAHVVSRGGLAVALSHLVLASERSLDVDLAPMAEVDDVAALFGESTGRIVFTVAADHQEECEATLGGHGLVQLARVGPRRGTARLRIRRAADPVVEIDLARLRQAFMGGLRGL